MMELRHVLLSIAEAALNIAVVKGTLLVTLAAAIGWLARRSSAARRSGIWGTAVGALVVLPALWYLVPWWEVGVVTFPRVLFATEGAPTSAMLGGAVPPALWIGIVWSVGAIVLAAHFGWQRLGVELAARGCEDATDERTVACVSRVRADLALEREVRVVHCELASSPYAFGIARPTIVLPTAAMQWSADQLDAVMRHELAHVSRGDYLLLVLGEIARVLYWPNPLVWLLLGALRRAQDAACDDLVLRGGVPATAYARHLVAIARDTLRGSTLPGAALPLLRRCDLRERIGAVLDRSSDRRPLSRRIMASCGAVALALAVTIASANVWICPTSVPADGSAPAAVASVSLTASRG